MQADNLKCLAQLCTEDGATLWHSNQADNIDDDQLRELAFQWNQVKQAKLNKIIWPDAAHLAEWLLQEHPSRRPQSWDQVMQHPALASVAGLATRKRVGMSCPEMGTLDDDGGVGRMAAGADAQDVYNQDVMAKVSELQQIGFVKFGFDRAGTSTAVETIEEKKKWSKAFDGTLAVKEIGTVVHAFGFESAPAKLQDMIEECDTDGIKVGSEVNSTTVTILSDTIDFLDLVAMVRKMRGATPEDELKKVFCQFARATPDDMKKQIFKVTDWWYGYQTSVKQAVKLESQGFDGVLDVICIRGGLITQLEAAEMERIMKEAISDCAKSGITVRYTISYVSYRDFVLECEPWRFEQELSQGVGDRDDGELLQLKRDTAHTVEPVADCDQSFSMGSACERTSATSPTDVVSDVEEQLRAALDLKDKELVAMATHATSLAAELATKDKEYVSKLAAMEAELAALRAACLPSEAVPPT